MCSAIRLRRRVLLGDWLVLLGERDGALALAALRMADASWWATRLGEDKHAALAVRAC